MMNNILERELPMLTATIVALSVALVAAGVVLARKYFAVTKTAEKVRDGVVEVTKAVKSAASK